MKNVLKRIELGKIASIGLGFTHTPTYVNEGVPFISVKDISNGYISFEDNKFISQEEFDNAPSGAKPQMGDILFCRVGTMGKPVILTKDVKIATFVSVGYIRITDKVFSNSYVKYWMESSSFDTQVKANVKGVTIKNLNTGWLRKFTLPIYSKNEQQQIVSELDCLQGIIDKKKAQLQELDKLAQSIFYTMFGDPVENEKGWKIEKLNKLCTKITDGTHNSPTSYPQGAFMYITAKNIKADGICLKDITYVEKDVHEKIYGRCNPIKGDILYIKDGATTGIATINTLNEEFSLLSSVALLKCNSEIINNYFLKETLNFPSKYKAIRNNMGGAAITRLTIKKIQDIEIALPPLALQQEFADKITVIEQQKKHIQKSLQDTETLFQSRMDYYFG